LLFGKGANLVKEVYLQKEDEGRGESKMKKEKQAFGMTFREFPSPFN
jgi:hypothetical protein